MLNQNFASQMFYEGHRFYDPKSKRFLSPDIYLLENLEELEKRPHESSLYAYAGNNPINNFDPQGNKSWGIQLGGSFTVGTVKVDLPSVTLKAARNDSSNTSTKGSYSFSAQGSLGSISRFGDKTSSGYTTGVAGVHGSIGGTVKVSNADHVSQLSGKALTHGGSLGKGIDISASVTSSITKSDGTTQKNYSGVPVTEFSIGLGGGLGAEGHHALESNNTPQLSSKEIEPRN